MLGKVLITGGFGNLGSWLTIHLSSLGYDVYILSRNSQNIFDADVKYTVIECDITNIEELKTKLNFKVDFCIHTASYNEHFLEGYPKKALEINALGTRNMLEVLSSLDIKKFIYFSTFHVYGSISGTITEDSPLNPKNDYATTHLFAEYYIKQFALTHNIKYTILRLTNSYGCPTFVNTDKWYLILNDLIKSAYDDKKIVLKSNGKSSRDFIWMGDVCKVVTGCISCDYDNNIFNLSSNILYSIIELTKLVQSVYYDKFNELVEIQINDNDLSNESILEVSNNKLVSSLDIRFEDKLISEIEKTFDLLVNMNDQ